MTHLQVENECISYNFRLFAIFMPKNYQIWLKFDVVITKKMLLVFFETRYRLTWCHHCV